MPTYGYYCADCEYTEEQMHSIKKDPVFKCPKCEKKMKRQIGPGLPPQVKGGTPKFHGK